MLHCIGPDDIRAEEPTRVDADHFGNKLLPFGDLVNEVDAPFCTYRVPAAVARVELRRRPGVGLKRHRVYTEAGAAARARRVTTHALITRCGTYRYALWRRWSSRPQVLFVMLNPSTADHRNDDPTIRRCIGLAKSWGFGAVAVGNLFAFRTPSPRVLREAAQPVGRANDRWLQRLAAESSRVIAAWGNHGSLMGRDEQVRALLGPLYALSLTKRGQPRHPLYVPGGTRFSRWR